MQVGAHVSAAGGESRSQLAADMVSKLVWQSALSHNLCASGIERAVVNAAAIGERLCTLGLLTPGLGFLACPFTTVACALILSRRTRLCPGHALKEALGDTAAGAGARRRVPRRLRCLWVHPLSGMLHSQQLAVLSLFMAE